MPMAHIDVLFMKSFFIVNQVLLEHRLKEMDDRFNEQIRKNQALMREFELQTDRQKYMNREFGELRKQLGESAGKQLRTVTKKNLL